MSENLLGTFISKEYPLKKVLRIVSNEAVLVVRLNNEVTPKLNLLEIKAQILEEEKLVKHLQKQEQELEAAKKELERARSLLEHQDTEIARLEAMIFLEPDLNASTMSDVGLNTSSGSETSDTLSGS